MAHIDPVNVHDDVDLQNDLSSMLMDYLPRVFLPTRDPPITERCIAVSYVDNRVSMQIHLLCAGTGIS